MSSIYEGQADKINIHIYFNKETNEYEPGFDSNAEKLLFISTPRLQKIFEDKVKELRKETSQ